MSKKRQRSDAECAALWRQLEAIVDAHIAQMRREMRDGGDPWDYELVSLEPDDRRPRVMVADMPDDLGHAFGEGANLAEAVRDCPRATELRHARLGASTLTPKAPAVAAGPAADPTLRLRGRE